ncbi:Uncharacterised protein [Mycobacteroides abscessus subsp. abscessus]|nr:Uncharacterised protein [Mycobacteroides abscessus subsp. abscessus]
MHLPDVFGVYRGVGGVGLLQPQPAVHFVADRQLVRQTLRRGQHQVHGPAAEGCAGPVGAVEHGPGPAVDHDGHRQHGPDALGEHRHVVVVRDGRCVPVVGHRERLARDHAGAAEPTHRAHRQPPQATAAGAVELGDQQRVVVHLAAEHHGYRTLGPQTPQLSAHRVGIARAQQGRAGGHGQYPLSGVAGGWV